MLAVLVSLSLTGVAPAAAHTAAGTLVATGVEATYSQPGPWAVTTQKGFGCCDSTGAAYDIWYPANLGAGGFRLGRSGRELVHAIGVVLHQVQAALAHGHGAVVDAGEGQGYRVAVEFTGEQQAIRGGAVVGEAGQRLLCPG